MPKRVVVANPNAGSGKVRRNWNTILREINRSMGAAEGRFTKKAGDASRMVTEAILEGAEQVIVVGGDGSVNEAVNGWFDAEGNPHSPDASLVIYPHGTGGDFARSIGVSGTDIKGLFVEGTTKPIDVGIATMVGADGAEVKRYFLNISSFGSSGVISDNVNRMSRAGKLFGGKAAYAFGTVKGLVSYRNQRVRLRVDDIYEKELLVNTVAVANGRYFGGSMKIAPGAYVNDGLFDVVVIGDISLVDFIRSNGKLYRGEHLDSPGFSMIRGKKVVASVVGAKGDALIETDGETPGRLPVTYEILPNALKVFAPWGRAEAAYEG